jgi:integrase
MEIFIKENILLNDDKKSWDKLSLNEKELIVKMKDGTRSSVRSLCQYLGKVKSIYKKNKKKFNGDIEFLKDKNTIDLFLSTYKGKKDYYYAITLVLKSLNSDEELIKHYTDKMIIGVKQNKKEVRDNKKTETQVENWINYDTMIDMFTKNKNKLEEEDRFLLSLIIIYPRRVQDWRLMKLNKSKNQKLDLNYNYININKFGTPTTFNFNRSKSQNYEPLGTTHTIPNKLKKIISKYISKHSKKDGELFFGVDKTEMNSNEFSKRIKSVFKVISGKEISSNTWRHIVSSDLENKNLTLNEREDAANKLGHSLLRSLEYSKK